MNTSLDTDGLQREYDRLCQWRAAWTRLLNDPDRMRRLGNLQSTLERIEQRAMRCNRQIAGLMRDFDARAAASANNATSVTADSADVRGDYAYHMGRSEYQRWVVGSEKPRAPLFEDLPLHEQAKWIFIAGQNAGQIVAQEADAVESNQPIGRCGI